MDELGRKSWVPWHDFINPNETEHFPFCFPPVAKRHLDWYNMWGLYKVGIVNRPKIFEKSLLGVLVSQNNREGS